MSTQEPEWPDPYGEEPDERYTAGEPGIAWFEDRNGPVQVYLVEDEMQLWYGDAKSPEFEELLRQQRVTMLDRVREILRGGRHG